MSRLAELLVLGFSLGALYALMGVSVTVVFQAARVPNVAFIGIGAAAAVLHWDLTTPRGRIGGEMAWWPAMIVAALMAAVLGIVTGLLVRPLAGRTAAAFLLLAGWTVVLLAGVNAIWGTQPKLFDQVWRGPQLVVGDISVRRQEIAALGIGVGLCLLLVVLARTTRFGLALRVFASDPEAAPAMGIDPARLSTAAWALGSVLAAVALTLAVNPVLSNPYETTVYLPFAFGAALLGGLRSLRLAVLGGLALGVVPTLLDPSDGVVRIGGVPHLVAFVMIALLVVRRPHLTDTETNSEPGGVGESSISSLLPGWARRVSLPVVGLGLAVLVPLVSNSAALTAWTHGLSVFLVCASIVMVMGWSGEVALGQVAFAGVGAYTVANLAARLDMPHVLAIPLAAAVALIPALVVGLSSRRAQGRLPFAVISVGLMVVASSLLWGPRSRWFTGEDVRLDRPDWMDILSGRPAVSFYLLSLVVTVAVVWFALNLRSSRVGRALAAGRESPNAARSLGIDPAHYRLVVLVFAALIAATGGIIEAYLVGVVDPSRFVAFLAVQYLLYAVVGGAGSLAGTAVVVFVFEVLPALGDGTTTSSPGRLVALGLLAVAATRFFPGGLAGATLQAVRHLPGSRHPMPVTVGAAVGGVAVTAGGAGTDPGSSGFSFDARLLGEAFGPGLWGERALETGAEEFPPHFDLSEFDQTDFGDIDFDSLDFGSAFDDPGEGGETGGT